MAKKLNYEETQQRKLGRVVTMCDAHRLDSNLFVLIRFRLDAHCNPNLR